MKAELIYHNSNFALRLVVKETEVNSALAYSFGSLGIGNSNDNTTI